MSDTIIKVENLSKRYRIGAKEQGYKTFREAIIDGLKAPIKNYGRLRKLTKFDDSSSKDQNAESAAQDDIIWALRDVSFEVKQGEVIGIIGRNGAGKTTLLKILSRITEPTKGDIKLYGRVSSLLEVGTGFHPELTGRENIYLNGAILGMRKEEINRKFKEIVDFAEIEKFLDTPVKRYSSGMYVRLAFAVAAHLEPEILLVDEVLAVGDVGFQKKCLGKMDDVATAGRTVLFVSHNMAMIEALCPRSILLEDGQKAFDGPTSNVIAEYMQALRAYTSTNLRDRVERSGTGEIRFTGVKFLDSDGNQVEQVRSGKDCILSMTYESLDGASFSGVTFGASFYSRGGHLFSVSTQLNGRVYDNLPSAGEVQCNIPRLPVAPGGYEFNIICRICGGIADWVQNAGMLIVSESDFFGTGQLPPTTHPGALVDHTWSVRQLRP